MLLKKILSKQNYITENYLQNKLLSKNEYNKLYIRNQLNKNETILVSENNSTFDIFNSLKEKRGNSFVSNPFLLTNQRDKTMKLRTFFTKNLKNLYLKEIYENYKFLTTKKIKNKVKSVLILKPVKGGFSCFSRGVVGFLPRRHGNMLLKKKIKAFFCNRNRNIKLAHIRFLLRKKNKKRYLIDSTFLLRLSFFFAKLKMYPQYRKNVFVSSLKNKSVWGEANFVFLSKFKKNKTKQNKNEKIKTFIRRKKIKLSIKKRKCKEKF
jgi:hypothetical protein